MRELAEGFWERAQKALEVARAVLSLDPDTAASRAYYCAFYAVSAHFAVRDQTFKRYSAVEAAVHRGLVKAGAWPRELGARYSMLVELRRTGDYGTLEHVSTEEGRDAVDAAAEVLQTVAEANDWSLGEPDA